MKHHIYRVHPIGQKAVAVEIDTDNLSETRKQLCEKHGVKSVLLYYETEEGFEDAKF